MKLNLKEVILFKEMTTMMDGFDDLTKLSVATLIALQNVVCVKWLKDDKSKPCTGCPLNTLGICREITTYCKAYEESEEEENGNQR